MSYSRQDVALHHLFDTPVYFEGFKSSVGELHRSGWEISTNHDYLHKAQHIMFSNPGIGLASHITEHALRESFRTPICIKHVTNSNSRVRTNHEFTASQFKRIVPYLKDEIGDFETFKMHDFPLSFLLGWDNTQEIIFDDKDKSVEELLSMIIDKQRPLQEEFRAEKRKELNLMPKTKAKIITLSEYRGVS